MAKQLIDERPARADLPLPREFPPGLDDLDQGAPGRHGHLAAGRQGGRFRRHRRPAGPLHRHGHVAQRRHHRGLRHDRDVRQGANEHRDGQGRAGGHRRRLHVLLPVRERLAGQFRVDPLRPRPQGPVHVRDQRRERLDRLGPARPASARATSIIATSPSFAAGGRSTSPTAICRT